ncbi:MAG: hypothetical protein KAR87_00635 [Candidatus Aenigmarchaeota archaeon]|nr:hypothetical protein [Candidatus Aenigmarchaeota archaeon]
MATTVQMSRELQQTLTERKFSKKETYEEVIWDLIEDGRELDEQTKKELEESRDEIKQGNFYTLDHVKKELNL